MSEKKNTNPKKRLYYPVFYEFFLGLQFIASAVFLYTAMNRMSLSLPKLIGGIIILSFLLLLNYFLLFSRINNLIRIFSKTMCILLSVGLLISSTAIKITTDATTEIGMAADSEEINISRESFTVCIAVREDSATQTLSDLASVKIGYNRTYDEKMVPGVTELLKNEGHIANPSFDDFTNYKYMVDDLFADNPNIGAVLFNEGDKKTIKKCFSKYDATMRIIGKYSIECEEQLAMTAVNDVTTDPFIVYISGLDIRTESVGKQRTDANMIAIVNPVNEQVLLLGIPRDYYVYFPSFDKKDKLNHSGNYGIKETMLILENLLDMKINYYAQLKFQGAIDIVDAVGGLDVYSPVTFLCLDEKYLFEEGINHMDGDMALYFMRSRKMLDGGDNDRVSNQIRVLKTLISKLCNPAVFTSSYTKIMAAMKNNVHTNMTSTELNDLIQLQITKMPRWDINNYQLEGTGSAKSSGSFLMLPDEESVEKAKILIDQMLSGQRVNLEKIDEPLVDFINAIENPDYSNHESESERQSQ